MAPKFLSYDKAEAVVVACALCADAREAERRGHPSSAAARYRLALRAFEFAGDRISIATTRSALARLQEGYTMAGYRVEAWSLSLGWRVLPGHENHATRAAADEWAAELTRPGRLPLRLPGEVRVVPNAEPAPRA